MLFALTVAYAAEITVFTQTPAYVTVDSVFLDYPESSLLLSATNLAAGKHTVKIESLQRKTITQMDVTVRQDERVDLAYGQRTLQKVGGGLVGDTPVTAGSAHVGGTSASVQTSVGSNTVISMGIGGFGGMSGLDTRVYVGGPEVHPVTAPTAPVAPRPPEPPKPAAVQVVFSLKDNFDMSNIYVDGTRVAELRTGDREKSVTLMSGTHTVEIKDFTEFETWFKGSLLVTAGEPIRVGYGQDEGLEVYNREGAWAPR